VSQIIESDRACNSDDPTQLRFHPLADLFPLMEGEEFAALVADIKARGLLYAIEVLDGKILDGRNRYRACLEAGVEPLLREHSSDCSVVRDPLSYIISANVHRRHLTTEQKRELIAKLLRADPSKSDRQIAKTVNASPTYVGKVRAKKEATGDVSTVDTRTDTKGRKQPAKKARGWSRERYKTHRARKKARAALSNPIIKAWSAANDFNRANFVRLYRKDIEQTIATIGDDPDPEQSADKRRQEFAALDDGSDPRRAS
jgi:ParB-like chromosome segregation protein Spo0J